MSFDIFASSKMVASHKAAPEESEKTMHQETILLLDGDVSARGEHLQHLQEAGYLVQKKLFGLLEGLTVEDPPELVIASMPLDSNQQEQIKKLSALTNRPFFLFLLSSKRSQDATEALELGADDILQRPFSSRDLHARLKLLGERRRRDNIGKPGESGAGQIDELSVQELIHLFGSEKGTATVSLHSGSHRGKLYFRNGELISVIVDHQQGLPALVRAIRWEEGQFEIYPQLDENQQTTLPKNSNPLKTATKTAEQWDKLLRQLPPTNLSIQVDFQQVQQNLDELNDLAEQLLWQLASHSSLEAVINDLDGDPIDALTELCHLYEKNYFTTRAVESASGVLTGLDAPSFEGIEASLSLHAHQSSNSGFSNRLADAAREAAAQLMAAARPISDPTIQEHPDHFPSFLDMEKAHRANGDTNSSFSGLASAGQQETLSDERLTSALFPLEKASHPETSSSFDDNSDDSFAMGDFKNLSAEPLELPFDAAPPLFDTTVPSLEAPGSEEIEAAGVPPQISLDHDEMNALPSEDKSTGTLGFLESIPSNEVIPPNIKVNETATYGTVSPESSQEGVRQLLQFETMDVLDRLLQNELSSIPQIDAVPQPTEEEVVVETSTKSSSSSSFSLAPSTPKDSTTPAASPIDTGLKPKQTPKEDVSYPARSELLRDPQPVEEPQTNKAVKIQLQSVQQESAGSLSMDDLPSSQKGNFPSLSLSDEFFQEEELRPVKPSKIKGYLLYGVGCLLFMVVGFFGMDWFVNRPNTGTKKQQIHKAKPLAAGISKRREPPRPVPLIRQPKPLRLAVATPDAATTNPDQGGSTPPINPTRKTPVPVVRVPVVRAPVVRRHPRPRPRLVARARPRPRPRRRLRIRPRPRRVAKANNERKIRGLLRRALRLKRREKFAQSERVIRQALRLKPKRPATLYSALGQVLYEREKTGPALRYLQKAYRISPRQTGPGLVTLGSIFYEKGKRKYAKKIYRQYLRYFPRGKNANDVKAMLKN